MVCDDFRSMLETSGTDVWEFIDTVIAVSSMDYGDELKVRRDSIVEKLYGGLSSRCRNCDRGDRDRVAVTGGGVEEMKMRMNSKGYCVSRKMTISDEEMKMRVS
ncbi:unnamed protein product [Rhodiola kirilowii]